MPAIELIKLFDGIASLSFLEFWDHLIKIQGLMREKGCSENHLVLGYARPSGLGPLFGWKRPDLKGEERQFTNSPLTASTTSNDTVMTGEKFQLWSEVNLQTTRTIRHPIK